MLNVYKYYDKSRELSLYSELSSAIDQLEVLANIDSIEGYEDDEYEEKIEILRRMTPQSLKPLISIIMRSPIYAYNYAKHMLGEKRWPEGEPAIMKNPQYAYDYAKDVIKGRWPEAEKYIMKGPYWATLYARDIIRNRWKEAESYIMKSPDAAYMYAKDVIKGRWEEAEPVIMRDPSSACYYAMYMIKGRWLEAEDAIKKVGYLWAVYCEMFKIHDSE